MVIVKKVEALRKKPQHVRERILFISMAVIIVGMIGIWAATFRFSRFEGDISFSESTESLIEYGKDVTATVNASFGE